MKQKVLHAQQRTVADQPIQRRLQLRRSGHHRLFREQRWQFLGTRRRQARLQEQRGQLPR